MRYFKLAQGILLSGLSSDLVRYVFSKVIHTRKSDSLKS